jgi:hypothetical protein
MAYGLCWLGPGLGVAFVLACESGSPAAGAPASAGPTGAGRAEERAVPGSDAGDGVDAGTSSSAPPALLFDPRDPFRQRWVAHGDTSLDPHFRPGTPCAGLGPDMDYELDLRGFVGPVPLYLGLRSAFDGSLRVERGPSDDPFLVACNEDQVSGVDDAFLAVTLDPDLYRVVVDGERSEDAGAFELSLELPSRDARCHEPPANDRCNQAVAIDPALSVQTFLGTTECASDQATPPWECGDFAFRAGDVFYALDLTDRAEPVRLHATTDLEPRGGDTVLYVVRAVGGECAETLLCNDDLASEVTASALWAQLEPGSYLLAVEGKDGAAVDFSLQVELLPEPCSVSNDTCQTAQDIPPTPGRQSFTVWPMCGDDTIVTRCQSQTPSPDLFFRLDLSAFPGRVHVRAGTERAAGGFNSLVLMGNGDGTCGSELWCGDFDLWLEPDTYYLALDGFRSQQGPVQLNVDIETEGAQAPAECIDAHVAQCAAELGCCRGEGTQCWLAFINCGLARDALDCLCEAEPACCDGRGDSADCGTVLQDCGTFCAGFDTAVGCSE